MEPEIIEEEVVPEEPVFVEMSATVHGRSDLN